jgi:murein L,D-transpeptidase YcbB/YkuD
MIGWADRPAGIIAATGPGAKFRRAGGVAILCMLTLLWPWRAALAEDETAIARAIAAGVEGEAQELQALYAARDYRPAWRGAATLDALTEAADQLAGDGLTPEHYQAAELALLRRHLDQRPAVPEAEAAFDLRASRAWLAALRDLRSGRQPPPDWRPVAEPFAAQAVSRELDAGHLAQTLARLRPDDTEYRSLRAGLARYREYLRRGGWTPLPEGPSLRPGTADPRVVQLRARLAAEGIDVAPVAEAQYFDAGLAIAVRDFQRRHLLAADGVVGARTRAALNITAAARVDQLRVALERQRWLAAALPETHVLVDIAGYELSLVRDGQVRWRTRVVVGRPSRPTPVLRSEISYMTFNPPWTVPPTILAKDMLPRVRRDPGYLVREGIEVLGSGGVALDPYALDWSRPEGWLLRQRPGGSNPLGRVVFRFPNRHLVYLHDTPAPELFELASRAISSGCVRVEDALELVRLLLDDERHWGRAAIQAAAVAGETRRLDLAQPMPLLLWYRTLRVGAGGEMRFQPDIYGRDPEVLAALERAPRW